jgi:hypothetical protein
VKNAIRECVLLLTAIAVLEETALARSYLNCLTKKVVIVDAPNGTSSSSTEEKPILRVVPRTPDIESVAARAKAPNACDWTKSDKPIA